MSNSIKVDIIAPTGEFQTDRALLDEICRYLGRQEIVNTIQLSGFLARGRFDNTHPVLVAMAGPEIVGIATLTPGFPMLLSHVESTDTIPALVNAAIRAGLDLSGVMGPSSDAHAFAECWARATGGTFRPGMRQRLLAARSVRAPNDVPGTCRHMEPADHPLLISWFTAFNIEADGLPPEVAQRRGQAMLDRLDERSGGLLWVDPGGDPVSVACYKAPTANGIRIGPVFTPREQRHRGYAGVVTAATTQLMLDRGYAFACLYTDAANGTANHVYEVIGYEFVADSMQYRFAGGAE